MDFIQIGCISYDDLESDDQREWLENLSDDQNRNFVEITEGDASKVYSFSDEIWTLDELLVSEYATACYVAVDKDLTDENEIAKLDALRERSNASLFSGMIYYRPVEE